MNGDDVRNFSYELIKEMQGKIANGETLTDNDKRYLADLLRTEASNKDSDTNAYKAGLEFDARVHEAKMELIRCVIDNGVKLGLGLTALFGVVALAKHDLTGSFDKTALGWIGKLIKL